MKLCSINGCGAPLLARSYCKRHYDRWRRHGDPLTCLKPVSERGAPIGWLHDHAGHVGEGCLVWPFARHPDGRAHMAAGFPARIMCELAHGAAPSREHDAAHSCGNALRGCVHPGHLRWATKAENSADKRGHGTHIEGERHYGAKLTVSAVQDIRRRALAEPHKEIAGAFGVAPSCISKIINRKAWRHVQ